METFSARPLAAIAAANKIIYWSFIVTDSLANTYYWSTGAIPSTGAGVLQAHTFKIVNFSGITLRRNKSEAGIHAANDASFTIVNSGNALTAANFTGGSVLISLLIDDGIGKELCGSWRFRIKAASPYAQQIDIECEDFVQEFLKGSYPNTPLVNSIFPAVAGTANDNICVPEPYGTCYIPLRSVYAGTERYYLLGLSGYTYTVEEVRSPRQCGAKITWTSPPYTFTQSSPVDANGVYWTGFQPLIADGNSGIFIVGSQILDVPTKFSRDDTVNLTNPADVIHRVLNNMGMDDSILDLDSFTSAAGIFYLWGTPAGFMTDPTGDGFIGDTGSDGFEAWFGGTQSPIDWNFAFWYKEDRTVVLARLLAMCHSCLIVGDKIKLQPLSKTSVATITQAHVMKMQEVGADTFKYATALLDGASDSGYVAFQQPGESQDEFIKILVPAKTTTNVIDSEVVTFPGVSDTQQAQILGTQYYQRKLLKKADVSLTAKGTVLAIRPDDVITVSHADYGGTYDVLVDELTINPDISVGISAIRFAAAFDDWTDLTPGAITIAADTPSAGVFSPAIVGPDTTPTTGEMPNAIKGRLRVGVLSDYIVLDPASPLRMSMYAGDVEQLRIGNLNGFLGYASDLYGIAIGDASNYLKYEATYGLRISGAIQGGTIDIGGSDASSFHIDSGGNLWLGAAAFDITTNPFAVSAAGALRAVSGAIAGFSIDPTEGLYAGAGATRVQMKPGAGFWAGATVFAGAPFRVDQAGNLVATAVAITGTVNATAGSFAGGYLTNMTLGKTGVASGILMLQLSDGLGDTYIASGKTDFTNDDTGFILGIDDSDSNTPKFYIGSATKYLTWDGTNLTITGATLVGVDSSGTVGDSFTVNSDLTNANADLVLGRTTGGNATLRWNGTLGSFDKSICLLGGLHVGGASDPGDNNLLVDGTGTIVGAFGCNGATVQTAYASGGALSAYAAGTNGFDSGANASALHAMVVKIRACLVSNGIMS